MAEKGFGVKEINLIGASGTPTIESPNNLNLNAVNVAISTNVSIGGTLSVTGNVSVGGSGGAPNDKPVGAGDAILWWLCCMPIGFSQWNQAAKGWLWLVIALLTGFGGIICLVDYILCYQAQKKRKLDEWEFFPSA